MKRFVRTGLTSVGFGIIVSDSDGDLDRIFPISDDPNFTVKQFVNYVARLQSAGYDVEFRVEQ